MFEPVKEVKWNRTFVNPCQTCEHSHACGECPHAAEPKAEKASPYREGKLNVASGEDVFA